MTVHVGNAPQDVTLGGAGDTRAPTGVVMLMHLHRQSSSVNPSVEGTTWTPHRGGTYVTCRLSAGPHADFKSKPPGEGYVVSVACSSSRSSDLLLYSVQPFKPGPVRP